MTAGAFVVTISTWSTTMLNHPWLQAKRAWLCNETLDGNDFILKDPEAPDYATGLRIPAADIYNYYYQPHSYLYYAVVPTVSTEVKWEITMTKSDGILIVPPVITSLPIGTGVVTLSQEDILGYDKEDKDANSAPTYWKDIPVKYDERGGMKIKVNHFVLEELTWAKGHEPKR